MLILSANGHPRSYLIYKRVYAVGRSIAEVTDWRAAGLDNAEFGLLLYELTCRMERKLVAEVLCWAGQTELIYLKGMRFRVANDPGLHLLSTCPQSTRTGRSLMRKLVPRFFELALPRNFPDPKAPLTQNGRELFARLQKLRDRQWPFLLRRKLAKQIALKKTD